MKLEKKKKHKSHPTQLYILKTNELSQRGIVTCSMEHNSIRIIEVVYKMGTAKYFFTNKDMDVYETKRGRNKSL